MAAPDRRKADRPPRWGYVAAILVSAAAHVGIAWFIFFILPGLWRQDFTPPPTYTVKVVDQIPAGDLGTRLPPLNDERQEAQEEKPPEENHEQAKPPEVKPAAKPPAPEGENDKNAVTLHVTPAPSPPVKSPTPTPTPTPAETPESKPAPAVVATIAPTESPTPEETPEPTPHPKRTPRPRLKPTPRPTVRATPRPRPRATPRPTPATVRKRPPPTVMIAKAEPTPSVKQRIAELHRKLLEAHLKEVEEAEKEKASENPGNGPVVASHVMPGGGYGVGPGMGSAGIEQDTEFLLYYKDVQEKIKDSWSFPGSNPNLTATVLFGINPDGSLSELRIVSSSSDLAFDDSVMRAIKRAAPFLPPPEKYRSQFAGGIESEFKLGQLKS